jgi:hypothetical protein
VVTQVKSIAFVLAVLVAVSLLGLGCARSDETGTEEAPAESSEGGLDDAAASRGLPVEGEEDEPPARPQVAWDKLTYEWRTSPERGLLVNVVFTNPEYSRARARGYFFLIATDSRAEGSIPGVYPPNTELDAGCPVDPTEGAHLLYRRDHEVSIFIPYADPEGYYDSLRVLLHTEDGRSIMDQPVKLEITGEPTGPMTAEPKLVL